MVPVNFEGCWVKSDDVWKYIGEKTTYVKVSIRTSYQDLLSILYSACNLRVHRSAVVVSVWNCYPGKQIMPPFELFRDGDVVTFVEINADLAREHITPLCITIQEVNTHSIDQPLKNAAKNVAVVDDELVSPCGLDDIKLDLFADNGGDNYHHTDEEDAYGDVEEDENNSLPDPFAYEPEIYAEPDLTGREHEDPVAISSPKGYSSTFLVKPAGVPLSNTADPSLNYTGNDLGRHAIKKSSSHCPSQVSSNIHCTSDKDFVIGEQIESKHALSHRLRLICLTANRVFRVKKSDRSRFVAECDDNNCTWRFRCKFDPSHGNWVVSKYRNVHTCAIDLRNREMRGAATCSTIAYMVKDQILDPTSIKLMLERVFGIQVTYWKAWKAREIAKTMIRGQPEESYYSVASYLWLLEQENPG